MSSPVGVTEGLARFISDTPREGGIPGSVADKAVKGVVDAFAAVLCGSASEVTPPLLRYIRQSGTQGEAIVLGTSLRTSPEMAALANGTFGAALDYDDVFSAMPGHPAAIIVPALCAEAARRRTTGAEFLDAFVVGYEVGARVAFGIGMEHYQKRGFHATGTLAMYCALAAVARLRALSIEEIRAAIGIASSMAGGLRCQFGTMMKPFHSGWAAKCGFLAVDLAHCGYTGSPIALEDDDGGFYKAYGTPASEPTLALKGLGETWVLSDPGFALKKYPSCYAGHRAIDGLMRLREELGLTADNVERVVCRVAPGALSPMKYPDPKTGLEAKFSIPYALAVGVLDGKYSLWSFTDEAVRRPEIRALLPRLEQVEDEYCLGGDPEQLKKSWGSRGFVEVEASTKDGRTSKVRVDLAPGHPKRELGWDEIAEKFRDCATTAGLTPAVASHLMLRLGDLRSARDMQSLLLAMRPQA